MIVDNFCSGTKVPAFSNHIRGKIAIDNKGAKGNPGESGLTELRNKIIDIAKMQPYWGEERPTTWCLLAHTVDKLRSKLLDEGKEPLITLADMKSAARKLDMKKEEEILTFLAFHHKLGDLVHFSDTHLHDTIILCPQWLGNVFRQESEHLKYHINYP